MAHRPNRYKPADRPNRRHYSAITDDSRRNNVQQSAPKNDAYARSRITAHSRRIGNSANRRVIHLQTLNGQQNRNSHRADNFFQPQRKINANRQPNKPARLGIRIRLSLRDCPISEIDRKLHTDIHI